MVGLVSSIPIQSLPHLKVSKEKITVFLLGKGISVVPVLIFSLISEEESKNLESHILSPQLN